MCERDHARSVAWVEAHCTARYRLGLGLEERGTGPIAQATKLKVFWLHVPKCGSVFETAIAETQCAHIRLKAPLVEPHDIRSYEHGGRDFHYPALGCAPFGRFKSGHASFRDGSADHDEKRRNLVTVLRHPIERVASGFVHNFHDCARQNAIHPKHRHRHHPQATRWGPAMAKLAAEANADPARWAALAANTSLVEAYARCVEGTSVKMLAGVDVTGKRSDSRFVPPTEAQAAVAVDIVRNHAGFVGVTELLDFSVCLYRRRFGGSGVTQLSFETGRASSHRNAELVVVETLRRIGWDDRKERRVYRAALERVLADACNVTAYGWCATLAKPEAEPCAAHSVAVELGGPDSVVRAHPCTPLGA